MSGIGEHEYSFSLTTFSPSGKLVQIEYALNAVLSGETCLGIKATNGVVLVTEKKLPSKLIDSSSVQKISIIAEHIGLVYSGMGPDARVLIKKGRKKVLFLINIRQNHILEYIKN
jgi:20S proteasome subunit alpha 2